MVKSATGEDYEYFMVRNFVTNSSGEDTYPKRNLDWFGEYVQNQNISWTNYRWLLANNAGEVVKDTGKIYEGKIETTFYGLTNLETYYVILIVEDNLGNSLSLGYKFGININTTKLGIDFTATLNSDLQAVELFFQDNSFKPSIYDTEEDKTSVYNSSDSSLIYENNTMKILGQNERKSRSLIGETGKGKYWFVENQTDLIGNY